MTSVTVLAAILLGPQLWGSGYAITIASDKKVSASEKERKTESLTFSANGEDQLIFSDTTFQVNNEGSRGVPSSIRRASDINGVNGFVESGWRPMLVFDMKAASGRLLDQLPQETMHSKAVADPWNKTRLIRFSEADIMKTPVVVPIEQTRSPSSNVVKFKDISSEEELSYEDSSQQLNVGEVNLVNNYSEITPRMLKFEENDGMKFEDDEAKSVRTVKDLNTQLEGVESSHTPSYEVYLVENLLKNTTEHLRSEEADDDQNQYADTQARIVKTESSIPYSEVSTPVASRNASRFFRFEDSDRIPQRPKYQPNPVRTFKFQENHSSREALKFPNDDDTRSSETSHSSGKPFKFTETESSLQSTTSSQMRFQEETPASRPHRFFNDVSSPAQNQDDQFYTVKATIQIDSSDNPIITPPSISATTRRPRRKKKKGKIYNQHGIDIRKQDGFNYQQPTDYDNYLQNDQQPQSISPSSQHQVPVSHYQANYQIPPTPQNTPDSSYYQNSNFGSPGTPYPPYNPNTYYIQNYLANYPYSQRPAPGQQPYADASASYPSVYPQQPNVPTNLINGGQSDSPISAQSIFGFLQSIFNFAPGTFGSYPPGQASGHGGAASVQHSPQSGGPGSPIMAVSSQLRKALDNIADNDELQCVPKLICMMSRRSSGQGFSTYVNRGLLSTVLSAVPDSSPWLKFSRAALLGYGIGANSCDVYYPKCPKDESEIIYYLNNHRGGFFRFFNDEHKSSSSG